MPTRGPGAWSFARRDGLLERSRGELDSPHRDSRVRAILELRGHKQVNARRLIDRLEGRDGPEPASIAHQEGILRGVVVALDRRLERKVQRGVKCREEVRPWHRVGDRGRFATRNSHPELADSLAAMEAGAPNDERVAAAHREPGRKVALDPDIEPRLVLLAVNRSLLAGKRFHRPDSIYGKLSSSRQSTGRLAVGVRAGTTGR